MPRKNVPALSGRTIRCLLFDFGETLWTRGDEAKWQRAERAGNERAGAILLKRFDAVTLPAADAAALGELVYKEVETRIRSTIRQRPGYEPDSVQATIEALQELGLPGVDSALACEIFEAFRLRIPESRHLFDDIIPTLDELRRRGFLLGVVTNRIHGGKPFLEDLQVLGLLDYFEADGIAISADLGIRKPNAAIFLHALKALDVTPEEAAMVGDSLRADVGGAKVLNIFAIWKPKRRLRAEALKELPAGTKDVDDEHLIAYAHRKEAQKYRQSPSEVRPDLIVEHLGDLLDVFMKAGRQ